MFNFYVFYLHDGPQESAQAAQFQKRACLQVLESCHNLVLDNLEITKPSINTALYLKMYYFNS